MARTRIDAFDRDLTVTFPEIFGAAARSEALAKFARDEFEAAQAQNNAVLGRRPTHRTFVDGARSENLNAVRPNGYIVFEFELLDEVYLWISEQLSAHSPVGSKPDKRPGHPGLYKRSHLVLVDGRAVDPGSVIGGDVEEVVFVNSVPYARKIDGPQPKPGLSKQAPNGVYHAVAVLASKRFGRFADIDFGFRSLTEGGVSDWAATQSAKALAKKIRGGNPNRHTEWLTRQPAIIVRAK